MAKLIFPQELEVWYLLPAIRKRVALGLIEAGLSQKEIAKLMFITEAAISQYKKDKRANGDFLGTKFDEEIKQSVHKIRSDNQLFFPEVMRLNSLVKDSGVLCSLHKLKTTIELPCNNCELNPEVSM